jgi:HD superfamily phosphodiesterase
VEHALRVARAGLLLGGEDVDPREMIAAALLHDVVNLPKNHPDRALASEQSEAVATEWLLELGFSEEAASRVGAAIRTHSFSRGEEPTRGREPCDWAPTAEAVGSKPGLDLPKVRPSGGLRD